MTGGEQICRVAVLGDGNDLPWRSARQLSENQIDFLFVDDRAVGSARVEGRDLVVGVQSYAALVVEGEPLLSAETEEVVASFSDAGGTVLYYDDGLELIGILERCIGRDLHCAPAVADLRSIHFRRGGLDFYLLFKFNPFFSPYFTNVCFHSNGHIFFKTTFFLTSISWIPNHWPFITKTNTMNHTCISVSIIFIRKFP